MLKLCDLAQLDALVVDPWCLLLPPCMPDRDVLSFMWRVLSWMPYVPNDSVLERQHNDQRQSEDMGCTV